MEFHFACEGKEAYTHTHTHTHTIITKNLRRLAISLCKIYYSSFYEFIVQNFAFFPFKLVRNCFCAIASFLDKLKAN
jgi:hypothetical protein